MTPVRPRLQSRTPDHEGAIAGAQYLRHRRIQQARGHMRPRILQLLATGGNGGAQESYTGLLLRLDRSKYEVHALSLSCGSAVQRLRRLGVDVEVVEATDDEAACRELAAYLRRNEIDLVHAHMYRAEVVGTRAAVAAGTPAIVATVHSSRVRSPEDVATLASLTPSMDRLIVPSESIAEKVRREGREGAPYSVIPNGVDLSRFTLPVTPCTLRDDFGIPCTAFLVGVVARLEAEKGHRYLIEAMPEIVRRAPMAWLVIVGEGSEEAALRAQAAALPAPARGRIVFTGRREDIASVTADLDVAALPSLREAQGISILEAMARVKPVVASAVGGVPEVLTDGVDGLLVPPESPSALADAIVRLAADTDLRERLGEAGWQTVRRRFSIDAQVKRIEAVYDAELVRSGALAPLGSARRRSGELVGANGANGGDGAAEERAPSDRASLEIPPV